MFKIIKKWYFKIYHLFKLLGIFILIFGLKENVFAEECNNLYKGEKNLWNREIDENTNWLVSSKTGSSAYSTNYSSSCNSETQLCLDGSKYYTLYALKNNELVDLNMQGMTKVDLLGQAWLPSFGEKKSMTKRGNTNDNVWRYTYQKSNLTQNIIDEINTWDWYLVEGTEVCIPTIAPPEPEETVYSNFLTLYLDKITYLANGFTTNPYLLTMIGIIFTWVVLEITIKIINIRRKK